VCEWWQQWHRENNVINRNSSLSVKCLTAGCDAGVRLPSGANIVFFKIKRRRRSGTHIYAFAVSYCILCSNIDWYVKPDWQVKSVCVTSRCDMHISNVGKLDSQRQVHFAVSCTYCALFGEENYLCVWYPVAICKLEREKIFNHKNTFAVSYNTVHNT
jgi:hypothetical protein